LYMKPAQKQTMYGYSAVGETINRTLKIGDIAGLEETFSLLDPPFFYF
jgi:hypothetical protein